MALTRREIQKRYRAKNHKALNAQNREYYRENKAIILKKATAFKETKREYDREYKRARKKRDPQYKISMYLRTRLYQAIKKESKSGSAVRDLGCHIGFLRGWLECGFQDGMTWENYGEWHIDHRVPLSSVDLADPEQLKRVCHWSNLQPLWAEDNLSKGAKIGD